MTKWAFGWRGRRTLAVALSALSGLTLMSASAPAWAAYPDKPVKILVAFAPGSSTDIVARILAQRLSETMGQAVIVETLKVRNMMKNARLAKHIGDASWHALVTKLDDKAREQGKHLVKIDPWFASSKTCHVCQHKMDAMPLSVRSWECPSCHTLHDRDINAALNIKHQGIIQLKAEGLSVSAHGGLRKSGTSSAAA